MSHPPSNPPIPLSAGQNPDPSQSSSNVPEIHVTSASPQERYPMYPDSVQQPRPAPLTDDDANYSEKVPVENPEPQSVGTQNGMYSQPSQVSNYGSPPQHQPNGGRDVNGMNQQDMNQYHQDFHSGRETNRLNQQEISPEQQHFNGARDTNGTNQQDVSPEQQYFHDPRDMNRMSQQGISPEQQPSNVATNMHRTSQQDMNQGHPQHHGARDTPDFYQQEKNQAQQHANGATGMNGMNHQERNQFQTTLPIANLQQSPAPVDCPLCGSRELTKTHFASGGTTHLSALLLCFTLCLGCIPYLASFCKDCEHNCGRCGALLAVWHRTGRTEVVAHARN